MLLLSSFLSGSWHVLLPLVPGAAPVVRALSVLEDRVLTGAGQASRFIWRGAFRALQALGAFACLLAEWAWARRRAA